MLRPCLKFKTLLQKVKNLRLKENHKNETLRLITLCRSKILRLNEKFPRPVIF